MNKKPINKLKVSIGIGIIILVIIAIVLVLMIFTDTFKSNKEIFVKDIKQFLGQEEANNNSLIKYLNKKQNTPSKNKGQINISNLEIPNNEDSEIEDIPIITFEGQKDPTKKVSEQNIEIQYSEDVTFPINYKHTGDIYGLQTKYASNKYIAIENNNLKEFAKNLGVTNTATIPNKIELEETQVKELTEEEKQQLKDKYGELLDKISDDKIVKVKTQTGNRYILVLTAQEVQDIFKQLFEILKNDEIILNRISKSQNVQTQIKEYLEQTIDTMESLEEEGTLRIAVETKGKEPVKIELQIPDLTIEMQKKQENDKLTYTLNITDMEDSKSSVCTLTGEFEGLNSQEQVTENYKLNMTTTDGEERYVCEYNYSNNVTFVDNVDIEELTEENSMILNEYNAEQIANFIQMLLQRIMQVNSEQMQELGIQNGMNPLMGYMSPFMMGRSGVINRAESSNQQMQELERSEEKQLTEQWNQQYGEIIEE